MRRQKRNKKMKYVILTITLIATIFIITEVQERKEEKIPYNQKPYDLTCLTPEGWVRFKTSSFAPYGNKTGLWRVYREDGSFFSSSMCQIEKSHNGHS